MPPLDHHAAAHLQGMLKMPPRDIAVVLAIVMALMLIAVLALMMFG